MLQIRRYQPQDNEVVKALNDAGVAQIVPSGSLKSLPGYDADLDNIENIYLHGGDFIVGLEDGVVVAMGAFKKKTATCAELKRLRVRPDCQRQGYGELIMRELLKLAAAMGYTEAFLDTLTTNYRAQSLFEKLGFTKSGTGRRGPFDLFFFTRRL